MGEDVEGDFEGIATTNVGLGVECACIPAERLKKAIQYAYGWTEWWNRVQIRKTSGCG
jgi:hypothetical protein